MSSHSMLPSGLLCRTFPELGSVLPALSVTRTPAGLRTAPGGIARPG